MKYVQNKDILTTELEESLMMMSIEEGKYFELNPISRRIWEIVGTPKSQEEIVDILLSEFDVSEEQCRAEIKEHLDLLIKKKILLSK